MEIANYDFLEDIYREYHLDWVSFAVLDGKPTIKAFYSNNLNFKAINNKLGSIANTVFDGLDTDGRIKNTLKSRMAKLLRYWEFISPIWDDYIAKNGADGYTSEIHNYMYALYFGTIDCLAILCLFFGNQKVLLDYSSFCNLSSSMMGKRLELYGICDEEVFVGIMESLASSEGTKEEDDMSLPLSKSEKDKQSKREKAEKRYGKVIDDYVAPYLMKKGVEVLKLNDEEGGQGYILNKKDLKQFVYLCVKLRDATGDKDKVDWEYFQDTFNVRFSDNQLNNERRRVEANNSFPEVGGVYIDEAIEQYSVASDKKNKK